MSNQTDERGPHDACPGSWCLTISCADCGEMLTNPKPKGVGFVGICMTHGRGSLGVLLRREDCLIGPSVIGGTET